MGSIGLKVYIPQLVHGLVEDDGDRRSQFCELFRNQLDDTPELLDHIIWSDESTFTLSGHMNKHNCVYYDTSNPHVSIQKHLNQPGVSVCSGLSSNGVISPIFIDETLTGAKYSALSPSLSFLQRDVLPILKKREDFNDLWFQHDGAPPHFAKCVRDFLDQTFPG